MIMSDSETGNFDPETGARDIIDLGPPPLSALKDGVADADAYDQLTAKIVTALKTVYDPEIPVDIYELGLVYKVDFEPPGLVKIVMTLTAPGCPVAGEMPGWVEAAIKRIDGVARVEVEMTFDPPWTAERMSDAARLELGWM